MNPKDRSVKRPYRKPALRQYGDLRRMTETTPGGTGKLDGGGIGKFMSKTAG